MNTSVTRLKRAGWLLLVALFVTGAAPVPLPSFGTASSGTATLGAGAAQAQGYADEYDDEYADGGEDEAHDGLTLTTDATLGGRIFLLEYPGNVDGLTGYFDQYRYIRNKDAEPAWFVDLFHVEIGLERPDETRVLRIERWSPNWLNERAEVEYQDFGIDVDIDYYRFRTDDLRVFPREDTTGAQPYAFTFTPDYDPANVSGEGHRLKIRRTGVDGDVTFLLDDLHLTNPIVRQLSLRGGYEERVGRRQDSFLLDGTYGESSTVDSLYRANGRYVDQSVVKLGAGMVIQPFDLFTGSLELDYESFVENGQPVTLGYLAQPGQLSPITPDTGLDPFIESRAVQYVPDTYRVGGSGVLSRRFAHASLHAGGGAQHLAQGGQRPPLQEIEGYDDAKYTTYSAYVSGDASLAPFGWLPLHDRLSVNGRIKYDGRTNHLDVDTLPVVAVSSTQVEPWLERLDRLDMEAEVVGRILRGSEAAIGYRFDWVDRSFDYPLDDGTSDSVTRPVSLVNDTTERHTIYARGRARLFRGLRANAEVGYSHAPEIGMARELQDSVYFDTRIDYAWNQFAPVNLGFQARVESGDSSGVTLTSGNSETKTFDLLRWNLGAQASVQPIDSVSLFASYVRSTNDQDIAFIRSTLPRYNVGLGQSVLFANESTTRYRSDANTLVMGTDVTLPAHLGTSGSLTLMWIDVGYDGSDATSRNLDLQSGIDQKLLSFLWDVTYDPFEWFGVGAQYRYDGIADGADLQPEIDLNESVHTISLWLTLRFDAPL